MQQSRQLKHSKIGSRGSFGGSPHMACKGGYTVCQGVLKASQTFKAAQRAPERRKLAQHLLAVVQSTQLLCESVGSRHLVAGIMAHALEAANQVSNVCMEVLVSWACFQLHSTTECFTNVR
eukprot:m.138732 g.138732  ORF g.138732 m.138732 type:complete len:121 (+) comp17595_c0_seq4:307-669(+)